MEKLIEKLYEETYSHKITPHTLLNNLSLSNYTSINFVKQNEILIAYVSCFLQNANEAEYRYFFKEDSLYKLESEIDGVSETLYDREIEKQKLVDQIKLNTRKKLA